MARAAARHRAAHQLLEHGQIFSDPLAVRILGEDLESIVQAAREDSGRRALRLFIAARTRFAEDALAAGIQRGVRQLVVLGAGLDTFAYRNAYPELRVFEVDHPATQAWKRERLASASIEVPTSLTFAPVDFEQKTLAEGLLAAGFEPSKRTFFTWLGVVVYLTSEAVWSTLRFIASLSGGSHVAFDYSNPPADLTPEQGDLVVAGEKRVAALGEAWINYFDTESLHGELSALGYSELEDLGPEQVVARYFPSAELPAPVRDKGAHLMHAAKG
jgi:methyltransferase (TIGR00027 family)